MRSALRFRDSAADNRLRIFLACSFFSRSTSLAIFLREASSDDESDDVSLDCGTARARALGPLPCELARRIFDSRSARRWAALSEVCGSVTMPIGVWFRKLWVEVGFLLVVVGSCSFSILIGRSAMAGVSSWGTGVDITLGRAMVGSWSVDESRESRGARRAHHIVGEDVRALNSYRPSDLHACVKQGVEIGRAHV